MDIKTVFSINGEGYVIEGTGQEAASAIIKAVGSLKRIFLEGFLINGNFVKVHL